MQRLGRSHFSIEIEVYCGSSHGMQAIPKAATAAETAICLLPAKPLSTKSNTLRTESLCFVRSEVRRQGRRLDEF